MRINFAGKAHGVLAIFFLCLRWEYDISIDFVGVFGLTWTWGLDWITAFGSGARSSFLFFVLSLFPGPFLLCSIPSYVDVSFGWSIWIGLDFCPHSWLRYFAPEGYVLFDV